MSGKIQHICGVCKKAFNQKGHLQNHLARKRPCKESAVTAVTAIIEKTVQEVLDYTKKTRTELVELCKSRGLKGLSGLKKGDLVALLTTNSVVVKEEKEVKRLNYIGSKFQLLDWISTIMLEKTGYSGFQGLKVADLFSGTGIVGHFFRSKGAAIVANDAEPYSSVITHAFVRSCYTERCKELLERLQKDLNEKKHSAVVGYITRNYTPFESCERMFFTVENGRQIDYVRAALEELVLDEDERAFLLASLLLSADAVSNVPAVYGCFLKNFKAKALKEMRLQPLHTRTGACVEGSRVTCSDVLDLKDIGEMDIVYLDPPYNERQYSKNYFPLNMIAKKPGSLMPEIKGKTGIPADCFMSPFCKKGTVEEAFATLFKSLKASWIFLSYNSESLVGKERMLELLGQFGSVSVVERDYKRFKSFEYNKDVAIKEYLYCLKKA
jgi:adenine-specific DNA-methyltransferase